MGIHDGHREKMRRRFLSGGLEQFADHEALELLLYYAIPRRDTNPIAHALIDRYGSLSAVLAAPVEDLQKVEGIGESAAILLKLVPRLCAKARLADADRQELILNTASRPGAPSLGAFGPRKVAWLRFSSVSVRSSCAPSISSMGSELVNSPPTGAVRHTSGSGTRASGSPVWS